MLRLPLVATLVIALVLGGGWLFAHAAAERKLAPLGDLPARGGYAVTLAFEPERFHQQRLQDAGRLVEVRARTVYLKDVTPSALRGIADKMVVYEIP